MTGKLIAAAFSVVLCFVASSGVTASATQMSFSADGRYLVVLEPEKKRIDVWDVNTGVAQHIPSSGTRPRLGMAVSSGSPVLAVMFQSKKSALHKTIIKTYTLATPLLEGTKTTLVTTGWNYAGRVFVSNDGTFALTTFRRDNEQYIAKIPNPRETNRFKTYVIPQYYQAENKLFIDPRRFAQFTKTNLTSYDFIKGSSGRSIDFGCKSITVFIDSPGLVGVDCSFSDVTRLFDLTSGKKVFEAAIEDDPLLYGLAMTPDRSKVVLAAYHDFRLLDAATGEVYQTQAYGENIFAAGPALASNQHVAIAVDIVSETTGSVRAIQIYDVVTGALLRTLQ